MTWQVMKTNGSANQSYENTIPSGHSNVRLKPTGKKEEGSLSTVTNPANVISADPLTFIFSIVV